MAYVTEDDRKLIAARYGGPDNKHVRAFALACLALASKPREARVAKPRPPTIRRAYRAATA